MRSKFFISTNLLLVLLLFKQGRAQQEDFRMVQHCVEALTDVLVHDITSPPVASRDYVYPLLAFYEAASPGSPGYKSFAGRLNELNDLPKPSPGEDYDWMIAGATAFYKTAYAFVFSKDLFRNSWDSIGKQLIARKITADTRDRSVKFGEAMAASILQWSKQDHFIHIRTLPRFTPGKKAGLWQPTGPDFMEAVEPYWNQLRPMVLSKPDQFLLPAPIAFNSDKFRAQSKEVYETVRNLSDEQRAEAAFWDCNPYATQTVGHLVYSIKKVSPGGHWIGITGIAIAAKKQSLVQALYTYSLVSVAIFDVIIAAWDEKYRSNYIRPISAIQQSMAPEWQPLLQTPPFPEYVSGHSVISMASAVVLTHLFGEPFNYTDSVEVLYGMPVRSFHSFIDAANEAAISRLYGGIHFREAIENGKILGKEVGSLVLQKMK